MGPPLFPARLGPTLCPGSQRPSRLSTARKSSRPTGLKRRRQTPPLASLALPKTSTAWSSAPGDLPPCIRQRPFGIAGDRQDVPFRVFAPHRGLRCMGNVLCMGLFIVFVAYPPRSWRAFWKTMGAMTLLYRMVQNSPRLHGGDHDVLDERRTEAEANMIAIRKSMTL